MKPTHRTGTKLVCMLPTHYDNRTKLEVSPSGDIIIVHPEHQPMFLKNGELIPIMPTPPGDALRKVTLNLFEADCAILEAHYGRGWSGIVRDLAGDHAQFVRRSTPTAAKTLGDLNEPTST